MPSNEDNPLIKALEELLSGRANINPFRRGMMLWLEKFAFEYLFTDFNKVREELNNQPNPCKDPNCTMCKLQNKSLLDYLDLVERAAHSIEKDWLELTKRNAEVEKSQRKFMTETDKQKHGNN